MHADAWITISLCVVSFYLLAISRVKFSWTQVNVITGAVALVPWLHLYFGLIKSLGNAGIVSAYLLGFLLAQLFSANSEAQNRYKLLDSLFIGIGFAALISIGLQLQQWLQLDNCCWMGMAAKYL